MIDTHAESTAEHFTEDDWTSFARGQGDLVHRVRVAEHLEAGCPKCEQTLRLWSVLLSVAEQEAAEAPCLLKARPASSAGRRLGERVAARVALVFDSFCQPALALSGVRASGPSPRQLLYKAGRYTIKVQVEPGSASDRMYIVGQILDEDDPTNALRDVVVRALQGTRTLGRTHTNRLGEFHLEPDATDKLQLFVDVPEIGTFTVESPRLAEKRSREGVDKAAGGPGRGKKARPR
jgi:hypothetical protein